MFVVFGNSAQIAFVANPAAEADVRPAAVSQLHISPTKPARSD